MRRLSVLATVSVALVCLDAAAYESSRGDVAICVAPVGPQNPRNSEVEIMIHNRPVPSAEHDAVLRA